MDATRLSPKIFMALFGDEKKEYQRRWLRARKDAWLRDNGPCRSCATWENLEIDHIDPASKSVSPSKLWSRSKAFREAELAKCQVLCENCHKSKTSVENSEHFVGVEVPVLQKYDRSNARRALEDFKSGLLSKRKACLKYNVSRGVLDGLLYPRRKISSLRGSTQGERARLLTEKKVRSIRTPSA